MRYGSVCSGIEAASVAWHPLGWKAAFLSEIEPFPCSVLAHHYPHVPNLGDMTKFKEWPNAAIDVLVGGTPCQSFSVAGLRKGLDDPRGNLMLTYLAIADRYRPRWLVWENVPGVLSSHGGRDFGTFLGGLGQLGYGFAYRVLDAQYFGVAQRRRRVFVVGCLGDWRGAAAVLFERHSLQGNTPPRRKAGQEVAGTFTARAKSGGWGQDPNLAAGGYMRVVENVANLTTGEGSRYDMETCNFVAFAQNTRDEVRLINGDGAIAGALAAEAGTKQQTYVAFQQNASGELRTGNVSGTLNTNSNASGRNTPMIQGGSAVRRLTPRECERLQGFPDDYTLIPHRGKPAADGPRYKALGNSMAVPVMGWIGQKIAAVDSVL